MREPRVDRIGELLLDHPCTTANDVALTMIEDLDIALHGSTTARPETPKDVWAKLLDEVRYGRKSWHRSHQSPQPMTGGQLFG